MVVSQSVISSWAISNGESSSEEKVISDFLSNYDGNEKVQLRDIIESDIEALKELGCLQAATLNSINNQKTELKNSFIYELDYGDVINYVEVLKNDECEISIRIKENDVLNFFTKKNDGQMILNGATIEISKVNAYSNFGYMDSYSTRATETWFQETCPYGSSSDYSYSKQTMNYHNIALGTRLENIAKSASIAILISTLPVSVITAAIAGALFGELVAKAPDAERLSVKVETFTHKNYTSGFVSPIITWVWKYKYSYYATTNCSGSVIATDYAYKCQM